MHIVSLVAHHVLSTEVKTQAGRSPGIRTSAAVDGATGVDTERGSTDMKPFQIRKLNENLEVVAKITDSMVQEYGCRVKYNKESGKVDLVGEAYCQDIVAQVLTDLANG
jgi:hypothetical protein